MPLARQLVDQWFTILGPLVQKNDTLSFQHPKKIGSILSHDALNPTHVVERVPFPGPTDFILKDHPCKRKALFYSPR